MTCYRLKKWKVDNENVENVHLSSTPTKINSTLSFLFILSSPIGGWGAFLILQPSCFFPTLIIPFPKPRPPAVLSGAFPPGAAIEKVRCGDNGYIDPGLTIKIEHCFLIFKVRNFLNYFLQLILGIPILDEWREINLCQAELA